MKKYKLSAFISGCLLLFLSCHYRSENTKPSMPVTTISMDDGAVSTKIEYAGDIRFSGDSTAIESISPGGYLIYRKNEMKLFAASNPHGQITLELHDGNKSLVLNETGKHFMAEAIKEMIAQGFRPAATE